LTGTVTQQTNANKVVVRSQWCLMINAGQPLRAAVSSFTGVLVCSDVTSRLLINDKRF
jgi:hypothetical protein